MQFTYGLVIGLAIGVFLGMMIFALMAINSRNIEPSRVDEMLDQYDKAVPHMPRYEQTQPLPKNMDKTVAFFTPSGPNGAWEKQSENLESELRSKPFATGGFCKPYDPAREYILPIEDLMKQRLRPFDVQSSMRMPERSPEELRIDTEIERHIQSHLEEDL